MPRRRKNIIYNSNRSVFSTLLNIYDGTFYKKLLAISAKKFHTSQTCWQCKIRLWLTLWRLWSVRLEKTKSCERLTESHPCESLKSFHFYMFNWPETLTNYCWETKNIVRKTSLGHFFFHPYFSAF